MFLPNRKPEIKLHEWWWWWVGVCLTLNIINTEVIRPLIILIVFINVACFSTYKIDYSLLKG